MIVEGTHTFAAPPETVWPLLLDPEVIGHAMPGARELVLVEPGKYRGSLKVAIGPITAAEFALGISIENPEAPRQFDMIVDANGKFGFTRGKAHVSLHPEDGGTRMAYRAELNVGGKIASVGQRLLDVVSRTMLRSGLEDLGKEVQRRLAERG
jgi:carbon monoxide dehydrogenase subunit G